MSAYMKYQWTAMCLLSFVVLVGGCASQPKTPAAAPLTATASTTAGGAPAAVPGAVAAPSAVAASGGAAAQSVATDSASSAQATSPDAILKAARSMGYKPQHHNAQSVYCRNEAPLGSRFEHSVCLTEDQVVAAIKNTAATQDYLRTATGQCAGNTCFSH